MSLRLSPEFIPCASPEELDNLAPEIKYTPTIQEKAKEAQRSKLQKSQKAKGPGTSSNALPLGKKSTTISTVSTPSSQEKSKGKNKKKKQKKVDPTLAPILDEHTVVSEIIGRYLWVYKNDSIHPPKFLEPSASSPSSGGLTIKLRDPTSPIVPSNVFGYLESGSINCKIAQIEEHGVLKGSRDRWTRRWRLTLEYPEQPSTGTLGRPLEIGEPYTVPGTPHELFVCKLHDSEDVPFVEMVLKIKGADRATNGLVLIGKKFRGDEKPTLSAKEIKRLKKLNGLVDAAPSLAPPGGNAGKKSDCFGGDEDGPLIITTILTPPPTPIYLEDGEIEEDIWDSDMPYSPMTSSQKRECDFTEYDGSERLKRIRTTRTS
ncbi:hypothetical protein SISSUDRAFT_1118688 [Sistotremastrum suecicum HHB10207 ss-3]|uniref:Uncharacterized protein n=1 Tax=Sistotremastrum suecicum HHB10207 ss-3 TaxID=1314776 RepID=A0A166ERR2_9AGAM|nr:hypothetical protein SISSUDRAFT_1118688 [Sistotremastrum suecicum HHB10207 ss-3]